MTSGSTSRWVPCGWCPAPAGLHGPARSPGVFTLRTQIPPIQWLQVKL